MNPLPADLELPANRLQLPALRRGFKARQEDAGEVTNDLALAEPQAPLALFGTSDPLEVISAASRVATALAEVVNERKLYAIVSNKKFPTVEAWTLCGS